MKKYFLFFLSILFLIPLFAENIQIVLPKLIYTGDIVEIRYLFKMKNESYSENVGKKSGEIYHLKKDSDFLKKYEDDFSLTGGFFQKTGNDCTVFLSVIPWKSGFLEIPQFSLATFLKNCAFDSESQLDDEKIARLVNSVYGQTVIEIAPIEVKSLSSARGFKNFLPHQSPLVLPGTTAFLVTLALLAFAALSLLIFVLFHIHGVTIFVTKLLYLYSLKKNTRKTVRKILSLQKKSPEMKDDKDFSEILQRILRDFLTKRFKKDFFSVATGKIFVLLSDLCGGELSPYQQETVENLISIFARLDFVRFSENANFLSDERDALSEKAIETVENFGSDGEN